MKSRTIRYVVSTSAILMCTTLTFAADAVVQEQLIPQAPEVEIDTSQWGGFYVGVYGGYSWFDADGVSATGGDANGEGAKIGGYTGYNWEFDNKIITGVEAFGGYSSAEETTVNVTVEQEWDASLRARLGYAFEQSVLYSFAGLAVTSVDAAALTGSDSQTLGGFTLGLGWETSITDNIVGRLEYGFSDYDSENFNLGNPTANSIGFKDQSVNVGIGFKY